MKHGKKINMTFLLSEEFKTGFTGVSKKIQNEIISFELNDISVQEVFLKKNNKIYRALPFSSKFEWPDWRSFKNVDVIYIRYGFSDYGFISFLRNIRHHFPQIVILLEIGSYPYIKELKGLGASPVVIARDIFYSNFLKKYINRIVTFRKYDNIFGLKTIYAINCANIDEITTPMRTYYRNDGTVHFLAVAQIEFYYGYDRLLKGISNYYKDESIINKQDIRFHLVGNGSAVDDLKKLSNDLNLADHVVFHGFKSGHELDSIYEIADIGIDCFGAHRKDDYLGFGTLKTREYLAKGLPFVTEYEIPDEVYDVMKYIYKVPADESDIDVNLILKFFDNITKETRENTLNNMRGFAYSYCHVSVAMNSVVDYIYNCCNKEY